MRSERTSLLPSADIHKLVDATSLLAIETPKLSAERNFAEVSEPFDVLPEFEVNTAFRDDGAGFRVILRTVIEVPIGRIECDTSAEYEMTDLRPDDVADEAFGQFVNDVAVMHILPYARQSIADITQRVFASPLLMPIMKRGDIHFDVAAGLKAARDFEVASGEDGAS